MIEEFIGIILLVNTILVLLAFILISNYPRKDKDIVSVNVISGTLAAFSLVNLLTLTIGIVLVII